MGGFQGRRILPQSAYQHSEAVINGLDRLTPHGTRGVQKKKNWQSAGHQRYSPNMFSSWIDGRETAIKANVQENHQKFRLQKIPHSNPFSEKAEEKRYHVDWRSEYPGR